jgi:hypothetical protein
MKPSPEVEAAIERFRDHFCRSCEKGYKHEAWDCDAKGFLGFVEGLTEAVEASARLDERRKVLTEAINAASDVGIQVVRPWGIQIEMRERIVKRLRALLPSEPQQKEGE